MSRKKVLITVTTYPLPSRSYDELVCTAGVMEDGSWIRIYPVPFKFLSGLRNDGMVSTYKFTWIELELKKRTDDFRPESYSPADYSFSDLKICGSIPIAGGIKAKALAWADRKKHCTQAVYTSMQALIEASRHPLNVSLATFKPKEFLGFEIEEDERDWKPEWKEQLKQVDLFYPLTAPDGSITRKMIDKLPYKFFYKFRDADNSVRRLMIEDWEIGQLFFNCVKRYGSEQAALQKVTEKYWDEFVGKKDLHLFLGTTREWHMRRAKNPFVIIGVFYPPKLKFLEQQIQLPLFG